MKLFIQIPCLNEEETLPLVLSSIPKKIRGIDEIEILIIDDGSTDRTIEVARSMGVTHFVQHVGNRGLARSFHDGVNYAMQHGADIVVNTDGDNQYPQVMIPELVQPIIHGEADIVIGDRQTATIAHFSAFKKVMQRFGTWVVNQAAGTNLPDAASGFRAYSRASLYELNVVTKFSYCMETIIQAGNKRLKIASIPITTNPKTRESRLFKNHFQHMIKSGEAIIRSYLVFKPFAFFGTLGTLFLIAGVIPFINYFIIAVDTTRHGAHLQSLILGVTFITGGFLCYALGVLADLLKINRIMTEDNLERTRRIQYDSHIYDLPKLKK